MKSKKFNIIRFGLIFLAALGLVGIKIYQDERAKEIIVPSNEINEEVLINASKEYIASNNNYFNEFFKEKDMEYRIDTDILVSNGLISNNDNYKGYIKIINDEYSFVNIDDFLIDKIIDDKNYIASTFNESMPFDLKYVFTGEDPNNYINIDDKDYRIIGITNSNHLKLISLDTDSNIIWGNSNDINYLKTSEKEKEESYDTSKGIFYVGYVRSKTKDLDSIIKNEKRNNEYTVNAPKYYGYYSLSNISDIVSASTNCEYKNILDITSENCPSYLINMLKNTYTSNTLENNEVYKVNSDGEVVSSSLDESIQGKKVIYVSGLNKYISGNGTNDDPYTFEK